MVDHDPMCREIVASLLAAIHIQTDIAADGVKATELAMRITYDLILIAAQLPIIDGFATARAIRAMPHHAATPILLLTDDALSTSAENPTAFNGQIDIPIDPRQLYSSIDARLKSSTPELP